MKSPQGAIKSVASRLGYEIRRTSINKIPENLPNRDCYALPPEQQVLLYQPWREPSFRQLLRPEIMVNTMLSDAKLYMLKALLEQCMTLSGDLFEAGTASGGSSLFMLDLLRLHGVKKCLWTLDTFEGYSGVDPKRDGTHVRDGDLRCKSEAEVTRLLSVAGGDSMGSRRSWCLHCHCRVVANSQHQRRRHAQRA